MNQRLWTNTSLLAIGTICGIGAFWIDHETHSWSQLAQPNNYISSIIYSLFFLTIGHVLYFLLGKSGVKNYLNRVALTVVITPIFGTMIFIVAYFSYFSLMK